MTLRAQLPGFLALAVLGSACAGTHAEAAKSKTPVVYRVTMEEPQAQYFDVTVEVPRTRGDSVDLAMPAWTPGSYLIRDFAKHVYEVHARRGDASLPVEAVDKQTWRVEHGGQPFALHYRVFAGAQSVRTSHLDDRHATINGASLFVYLVDDLGRPATVAIEAPDGWTVHSALESRGETLQAADYDTLVDSPIEVGTPVVRTFEVGDTKLEYVWTDTRDSSADLDRLVGDAEKIVSAFGAMMGGLPMSRYVFFAHVNDSGGGGLEHANSTVMMMAASTFATKRGYERAARLTAHEFFHLWNVKRIHDRVLGPFDYSAENHTELLWFHEGFTETMESLAMLRSGLWTRAQYLEHIASDYTGYRKHPGRNHTPIADLSHRAWTVAYQPEPNHRDVSVSYYDKGDLIGIALDLEIRRRSALRSKSGSVTGMFRRLMESHGRHGKGIDEADIVAAATAEAGEDMAWFFERFVHGVEEIELTEGLEALGVRLESRPRWQASAETKPEDRDAVAENLRKAWAGWRLSGTEVRGVEPGSPAAKAGLARGDELVAIDERRVRSEKDVQAAVGKRGAGKAARVHLFRRGALQTIDVQIAVDPHQIYRAAAIEDAELSDATAKLRDAWIGPSSAVAGG